MRYKEITNGWSFPTYEEAEAYVRDQTSGNYRIVGTSPFSSTVPLEELNSKARFTSQKRKVIISRAWSL